MRSVALVASGASIPEQPGSCVRREYCVSKPPGSLRHVVSRQSPPAQDGGVVDPRGKHASTVERKGKARPSSKEVNDSADARGLEIDHVRLSHAVVARDRDAIPIRLDRASTDRGGNRTRAEHAVPERDSEA